MKPTRSGIQTTFLLGLFLALICREVAAADYEIYVFDHPFTEKVTHQNGKMYVPALVLAKAMNLPVEEKDGTLRIGAPTQAKLDAKIVLNGKPFQDAVQSKNHLWLVELKSFVLQSGNKYILNKETEIIDILPTNSELLSQAQAAALVNKAVDAAPSNDFLTFSSAKYGISIKYPKNWEKFENLRGAIVAFRRPKENNSEEFAENLNVVLENFPATEQKITMEQYSLAAMTILKKKFPTLEVLESSTSTLAGNPAGRNLYSYSLEGLHLKVMQIYSIIHDRAYVITYTGTEEKFEKYLPTIQAMVNSFVVK